MKNTDLYTNQHLKYGTKYFEIESAIIGLTRNPHSYLKQIAHHVFAFTNKEKKDKRDVIYQDVGSLSFFVRDGNQMRQEIIDDFIDLINVLEKYSGKMTATQMLLQYIDKNEIKISTKQLRDYFTVEAFINTAVRTGVLKQLSEQKFLLPDDRHIIFHSLMKKEFHVKNQKTNFQLEQITNFTDFVYIMNRYQG